ncbi:TetR family transcriptional regulator [Arthrobacter sp. RIT-PI-e]|uniref:TetR/AcrR family transcriptional regulator n=1 Tax=Arthrobacter sp. RIT-PI-e TaxID=1681197 RepID=UPI0006764971|nr:TetR/AcrR family transcriptional regulator [Arthrobacter sp. RIT-PI-e]KNC16344.1 TetR family transcriptional regulator [Arthrobacter sp. RIT-PI-e]
MKKVGEPAPKQRLLRAAAALLAESGGEAVSTRQITQAARVTAPTLYHHFGDKEGLFDAVVAEGFAEYLDVERALPASGHPIEDLRLHWDNHVRFGLGNPHLYLVMFGNIRPERRSSMVSSAEAFLEEVLARAAVAARLVVTPREAARSMLAANIGVTLMLIAEPAEKRNLELSAMTREAVISAVATDSEADPTTDTEGTPSVVVAAIALNAALQSSHPDQLSSSELKLFLEWLQRISSRSGS